MVPKLRLSDSMMAPIISYMYLFYILTFSRTWQCLNTTRSVTQNQLQSLMTKSMVPKLRLSDSMMAPIISYMYLFYILNFSRTWRCLNTTRSFTHVFRLKQQWFSVQSTQHVCLFLLFNFRLYTSSFKIIKQTIIAILSWEKE